MEKDVMMKEKGINACKLIYTDAITDEVNANRQDGGMMKRILCIIAAMVISATAVPTKKSTNEIISLFRYNQRKPDE